MGEMQLLERLNFLNSEVRVVRFYQSCPRSSSPSSSSPPLPPRPSSSPAPDRTGHCRISAATARSQWALPGFSRDCQIPVGAAGLHLRAPDRTGHCRTSAATARSQWALSDFSRDCQISVGAAELHLRAPDRSGRCRTSAATARSQWALPDFSRDCQSPVGTAGLQPRLPDPSGHCRASAATARVQWALPDFSRERQIAVGTAALQPEFEMAKNYAFSYSPENRCILGDLSLRFFLWLSVAPAELAASVEGGQGMLTEIMEEAVADPHGIVVWSDPFPAF
eukprot:s1737_g7.t1